MDKTKLSKTLDYIRNFCIIVACIFFLLLCVQFGKIAYGLTGIQKEMLFPAFEKIIPRQLEVASPQIPQPSEVKGALIFTGIAIGIELINYFYLRKKINSITS